jgi:hypothetical protein
MQGNFCGKHPATHALPEVVQVMREIGIDLVSSEPLKLIQQERILAAKLLMVVSASIAFTLGAVHLVYTFWGSMLTPRDPALRISMMPLPENGPKAPRHSAVLGLSTVTAGGYFDLSR